MPLGSRRDCGEARYAGFEVPFATDVVDVLQSYEQCGFDFVVAPLVNPDYRRPPAKKQQDGTLPPPFKRSDLLLTSGQWAGQVVGRASQWIQPDAPDATLRVDSCAQLRHELEWAAHLSLQATILPSLSHTPSAANHAHVVNQVLSNLTHMALWQPVALTAPATDDPPAATPNAAAQSSAQDAAPSSQGEAGPSGAGGDPWEWWNQLRTLCDHHERLGVVLEVGANLPPQNIISRWYGEPVRALILPTSVFMSNKKGYPALSKRHQQLVTAFFQLKVQVVLCGEPLHQPGEAVSSDSSVLSDSSMWSESHPMIVRRPGTNTAATGSDLSVAASHPMRNYWEYMSYLFRRQDKPSNDEAAEVSYRDYLQAPLQPLQDNLESNTYETFERDGMKYQQYEEAILAALEDRVPAEEAESRCSVVMVVGAGRGPLVRASLQAARRCQRRVQVYAVEKNPHALVALHNLIDTEGWHKEVTVVAADMRRWEAPSQADILVSELLGSFGDNELSPECLDGAQRFLREDGISIPASYISYLQPITSVKLWNDVKAYNDREHFETPYVVKFWRYTPLGPVLPVFKFHHPNRGEVIDNNRSTKLVFDRSGAPAAVCHGFGGFFDTVLYGDITLSTHPDWPTPSMFSWFPIYFPLKDPVRLPADTPMEVHMWRCGRTHKVWYEWAVAAPVSTNIHNTGGRSYFVGL